jgi:predicted membrane-bound mannosyltransferase
MERPFLAETVTENRASVPSASVEEWTILLVGLAKNARKENGRREEATEVPAAAPVITIGKKEVEEAMEVREVSMEAKASTREDKDLTREAKASTREDSSKEDLGMVAGKASTKAVLVARVSGDDAWGVMLFLGFNQQN